MEQAQFFCCRKIPTSPLSKKIKISLRLFLPIDGYFSGMWESLSERIGRGDIRALARCISLVENESSGYESFLENLNTTSTPIIGITGPPGAGKSTLTDAMIDLLVSRNRKVAVLCVDPSSPFHLGALLGDRIRMSRWYDHPSVFIRSLASRGSLGGLNPRIIEISDLLKLAGFDYIIVETVGVGQSEIEIAGLADVTIVTIVPEAGDEIQTMKSGLMEIADLFVVNKSDRPGADTFVKNLRLMLAPAYSNHEQEVRVFKTVASRGEGVTEVLDECDKLISLQTANERHAWLLAERAWQLILKKRMKDADKSVLKERIQKMGASFNLYRFVREFA